MMSTLTRLTSGAEVSKPLRRAADDMELMHAEYAKLERERDELKTQCDQLAQENLMLRDRYDAETKARGNELEQTRRQRDQLQAYAVTLETKIDLIVDLAASVKRDAMRNAARTESRVMATIKTTPPTTGLQPKTELPPLVLSQPTTGEPPPAPATTMSQDTDLPADAVAELEDIVSRLPRNEYPEKPQ